ncbi:GNAT family N-acetyltransferase [Sphingomonas sp. CGMCC 1.13654]|uniref:GNAT family N-acetyltransferase n=1 Tax=Sphingomonas chungangi TaxID=2683589 RepID=A0A838L650_9SPHN|nr:GNAT family N-acetyltransferase [Sphingomonas chungangi]MBA2934185.1 GNAT family N-acetyltransferase [Sphingomonas chungangi]MVW57226.1 GNAT family N-acetyltransferase [Sphingomonas chungangi]
MTTVLLSKRLLLRPIAAEHREAIAALHADPRVAAQLVDGIPDTPGKADLFLRWNAPMAARGHGTFAVHRRDSAELIGLFSLTPFDGDEDALELGGKLFPSAWRGGLAVEAAAALIDHAFGTLDRARLVSAFHPDHRSAPASLARLGFAWERDGTLFGRPVRIMRLTRDGWIAQGCRPLRSRRRDSRSDDGGGGPDARYAKPMMAMTAEQPDE